jgi:Asp-tRNA(Asn)/Glu-tRNA(Gln) amidotransferase A subunit family amidase
MARDVAGCERMMEALAPGFEPGKAGEPHELGELHVGVAWTDRADPLVRARVEAVAKLFPRRRQLDLPLPDIAPVFERETAEVHAELWRDHRELYGDNVAHKLERAMRVTDAQAAAAARARDEYRERLAGLMAGVDLVLTPTMEMVAPPAGVGDLALRTRMIRLTYPWNAIGAPALALPCGPAEHGLPASAQLIGRPGDDRLVLAAGRLVEAALAA